MNKAIFLFLTLFSLGILDSSAQSIQEQIDKAARDPKRTENAARADVSIHKKTVTDSTQVPMQQSPTTTRKKKSKRCHKS